MGAGASAGSAPLKSHVSVSEGGEDYFIPLKNLAGHLKVFQHCTTGEVLVLVDHSIGDLGNIVDRPSDWFQVLVSRKQPIYLETLKVVASIGEKDSSFHSSKTYDSVPLSNQFTSLSEREKGNTRKTSDMLDSLRKNKLPPLSLFQKTTPTSAAMRRSSDTNINKKFVNLISNQNLNQNVTDIISSPSPSRSPGASLSMQNSSKKNSLERTEKDIENEFRASPLQNQRDSAKLVMKSNNNNNNNNNRNSTLQRRLSERKLSDEDIPDCSRRNTTFTDELDAEVEAERISKGTNTNSVGDIVGNGSGNGSGQGSGQGSVGGGFEGNIDASATLGRLMRENLIYNADSRTHSCQICGEVADDSYPLDQVSKRTFFGNILPVEEFL